MATERKVEVEWIGGLMDGQGTLMSSTSGLLPELEFTWDSPEPPDRGEVEPRGAARRGPRIRTSPMQLAHGLIGAGWEPEVITTTVQVSYELGIGITGINIVCPGRGRGDPGRRPARDRRAGKGDVPVLEGARGRGDHARAARPASSARKRRRSTTRSSRTTRSTRPSTRTTRADLSGARPPGCGAGGRSSLYRAGSTLERRCPRSRRRSKSSSARTSGARAARRSHGLRRPPRGGRGRAAGERARRPLHARAVLAAGAADLEAARSDPELAEMVPEYEAEVARLEEELKLALVERDPADEKDVIVEVRQGVGGDEAALWAADLARMLQRYAERRAQLGGARRSPSEGGGLKEGSSRSRATAPTRSSSSRAARTVSSASPRPSRRVASTRRPRRSP